MAQELRACKELSYVPRSKVALSTHGLPGDGHWSINGDLYGFMIYVNVMYQLYPIIIGFICFLSCVWRLNMSPYLTIWRLVWNMSKDVWCDFNRFHIFQHVLNTKISTRQAATAAQFCAPRCESSWPRRPCITWASKPLEPCPWWCRMVRPLGTSASLGQPFKIF